MCLEDVWLRGGMAPHIKNLMIDLLHALTTLFLQCKNRR
jgi:hypothetical protein